MASSYSNGFTPRRGLRHIRSGSLDVLISEDLDLNRAREEGGAL
jgi:hypothetical protein